MMKMNAMLEVIAAVGGTGCAAAIDFAEEDTYQRRPDHEVK